MPSVINKNLISDYANATTPKKDITGLDRKPFVVGAFNLDNTNFPKALTVKSGPSWNPEISTIKENENTVIVEPGHNTIYEALKNSTLGTTFQLKNGVYTFEKEQNIFGPITIIGSEKTVLKSARGLKKPFKSFFKVNENSTLNIKNVTFDGGLKNVKYAIISPPKNKTLPYNLFVENCVFKNFKSNKGATIKSYANTVADTVSFKNSTFQDNYRGLHFSDKENSVGISNANVMIIENTIFKNIEQYAVKLNKNDSNINPTKGKLFISNCVFSKVADSEKGKIINVKNIIYLDVKNSVFENSPSISIPINLKGTNNKIFDCVISSAGKVKATKGAIAKNIIYKNPKWKDKKQFIPSEKSMLLKVNNKITDIGLLR